MNKGLIMKISYCVLSLLVVAAIVINNVTVPVLAGEVESLPVVDVDVVGSYDSDNVYVTCNGVKYSIPRDIICSGNTTSNAPWVYPYSLEVDALGSPCPVSYWYSPSMNRIVVISSSNPTSYIFDYTYLVRSYSNNQIRLVASIRTSGATFRAVAYCTVWDCSTNSLVSSNELCAYSDDLSRTFSIDDGNGGEYNDLVCIFSTYEIKGFYEYNSDSKVVTPEYYFNYQYLFYTERNGYVFIDSSSPLDYISNASDPTKAVLVFEDECNKHVYTSQMGNSWIVDNNVSTMYGVNYQMDCYYFYSGPGGISCYTLVYCNDEGYEEDPLFTPEYGDINDVVSDLLNVVYIPNSGFEEGDIVTPDSKASVYEWFMYNSLLLNEVKFSFFDPDTGRLLKFEGMTIKGLFEQMFYELINIKTVLNDEVDDLTLTVHNDLKSVFDNITVTNTYLYDIKALIKDMPDYTASLNKTNGLLGTLNDNISNLDINSPSNSGGGSTSTDITTDFLITLDDDILVSLNDIKESIDSSGGIGAGSGSDEGVPDKVIDSVVDNFVDDLYEDLVDEESVFDLFGDNFVQSAISSIATGTLISGTFSNITSSGASSGVVWLNSSVSNIYLANNKVAAVLILGVTMSVVGLVVRKGV